MKERRRYRPPPIEKALCEFRFVGDSSWDLTVPGKLQAALVIAPLIQIEVEGKSSVQALFGSLFG